MLLHNDIVTNSDKNFNKDSAPLRLLINISATISSSSGVLSKTYHGFSTHHPQHKKWMFTVR